jgi:hypothetical protein
MPDAPVDVLAALNLLIDQADREGKRGLLEGLKDRLTAELLARDKTEALIIAALGVAQSERDTALRERDEVRRWVSDLQSGMYVNCVYCGHRYGPDPGTPVAMADVLKAHIQACPRHPMAKMREALRTIRRMAADPMKSWDSGRVIDATHVDEIAEEAMEGVGDQ